MERGTRPSVWSLRCGVKSYPRGRVASIEELPADPERLGIAGIRRAREVRHAGVVGVAQVPEGGEPYDLERDERLVKSEAVQRDRRGAADTGSASAPRLHGYLELQVERAAAERAPELGPEGDLCTPVGWRLKVLGALDRIGIPSVERQGAERLYPRVDHQETRVAGWREADRYRKVGERQRCVGIPLDHPHVG